MLQEVRAYVQQQVPILALAATASPAMVGKIEMALAMANTVQLVRSPDRENMKLVLQAYGKDDGHHKRYAAVLEDLLANGEKAKRWIVFCVSCELVSLLYGLFKRALGPRFTSPDGIEDSPG